MVCLFKLGDMDLLCGGCNILTFEVKIWVILVNIIASSVLTFA